MIVYMSTYKRVFMSSTARVPKSFTIDKDVDGYVSATKGEHSKSERVNELLRRAIAQERREKLAQEAAVFYAAEAEHRTGTLAFQDAALSVWERD
jgi:hypothetical protein